MSGKLNYPLYGSNGTARLVVAEVTICLPGMSGPGHSAAAVLQWGDPRARDQAARLIKDALGPVVLNPLGVNLMLRPPEQIRPAQIFLRCQTAPTAQELLQFLPKPVEDGTIGDQKIQVEPVGGGSYKMTMLAPDTVAEFLKRSEQLEPEFTLIRHALQRPYTRMEGDYNDPSAMPIPNFITIRSVSQMLATMAQCHLAQGKPEEALRDLTLMNDICRIMEGSRPMTLVSAMIDVAVRGLYAGIIDDGIRWQAWREPQLAALEEQLKQINLLLPLKQGFELDRVSVCHFMETAPPARLFHYEDPFYPNTSDAWTTLKASLFGGDSPARLGLSKHGHLRQFLGQRYSRHGRRPPNRFR